MRNTFVLIIPVVFFLSGCKPKSSPGYVFLEGFTQGTTFHITYEDKASVNYLAEINSIFLDIDSSMSIYRKNSIISGINRNDPSGKPDHHFIKVVSRAMEIANKTGGAFDITVGSFVNAWGFGFTDRMIVSPKVIDSLKKFVGTDKIQLINGELVKSDPRVQIDVNAIAKGYTVDVVAEFLETKGVKNYMVEIGGELRVKGTNPKGEVWRIGVDKPIDDPAAKERELQIILEVRDIAMATSGNYRKFYIEEGVKYSHTIDPKSGFPVRHNLLSATVFASNCMDADAYATAFMVMGLEKVIEFVKLNPEINVYLIYDSGEGLKTYYTQGIENLIE